MHCSLYSFLEIRKVTIVIKKERPRFTAPLPNTCQDQDNEWNKGGAGTNKGRYGGHEGANDNNDRGDDGYEEDNRG